LLLTHHLKDRKFTRHQTESSNGLSSSTRDETIRITELRDTVARQPREDLPTVTETDETFENEKTLKNLSKNKGLSRKFNVLAQ